MPLAFSVMRAAVDFFNRRDAIRQRRGILRMCRWYRLYASIHLSVGRDRTNYMWPLKKYRSLLL